MDDQKQNTPRRWQILLWGIPLCLIFTLGIVLLALGIWYGNTFAVPFKNLIYTLLAPKEGTGQATINMIVAAVVPAGCLALVASAGALTYFTVRYERHRLLRRISAGICAGTLIFSLVFGFFATRMHEYVFEMMGNAVEELPIINTPAEKSFYETYYADPNTVAVIAPDTPKNLICIYLESMETTYADRESGGAQKNVNYIPNLTALANANVSFSDGSGLGGFRTPDGTTWTMGALLAATSGIPFSLSVFGNESQNNLGNYEKLFPGLVNLGDILEENGYNQEFLCGSLASFAGRDKYFSQHGNYQIFDLLTAREQGYVPPNYDNGFWGFEDKYLYQIAKDEVTRLAALDAPFNLTLLTVDTHFPDGYICSECDNTYSSTAAKAVSCADRQVAEFVEWCQAQPFYEDTVIVIMGDHPRMDTPLVSGVSDAERTVYNCFINTGLTPLGETKSRQMTILDMFPTTLAALGFSIEGDRLGFGTNLFSARTTITEDEGYRWFNRELGKYHEYYVDKFLNGVK